MDRRSPRQIQSCTSIYKQTYTVAKLHSITNLRTRRTKNKTGLDNYLRNTELIITISYGVPYNIFLPFKDQNKI